jgi:hypothetical protein
MWLAPDTIIGGTEPIYLKKGISGGERKRLSIATELLLCPEVHVGRTECQYASFYGLLSHLPLLGMAV